MKLYLLASREQQLQPDHSVRCHTVACGFPSTPHPPLQRRTLNSSRFNVSIKRRSKRVVWGGGGGLERHNRGECCAEERSRSLLHAACDSAHPRQNCSHGNSGEKGKCAALIRVWWGDGGWGDEGVDRSFWRSLTSSQQGPAALPGK